jgi:hypothetical protein
VGEGSPCAAPPRDQLGRSGGSAGHPDQPFSKIPS